MSEPELGPTLRETLASWLYHMEARPWVILVLIGDDDVGELTIGVHLRPWPGRWDEQGICFIGGALSMGDYGWLQDRLREVQTEGRLAPVEGIAYMVQWMLLDTEMHRALNGFPSLLAPILPADQVLPYGMRDGSGLTTHRFPQLARLDQFQEFWDDNRAQFWRRTPFQRDDWRLGRVSYRTIPPLWLPTGIPLNDRTPIGRMRRWLEASGEIALWQVERGQVLQQWHAVSDPFLEQIQHEDLPLALLEPRLPVPGALQFAAADKGEILAGLGLYQLADMSLELPPVLAFGAPIHLLDVFAEGAPALGADSCPQGLPDEVVTEPAADPDGADHDAALARPVHALADDGLLGGVGVADLPELTPAGRALALESLAHATSSLLEAFCLGPIVFESPALNHLYLLLLRRMADLGQGVEPIQEALAELEHYLPNLYEELEDVDGNYEFGGAQALRRLKARIAEHQFSTVHEPDLELDEADRVVVDLVREWTGVFIRKKAEEWQKIEQRSVLARSGTDPAAPSAGTGNQEGSRSPGTVPEEPSPQLPDGLAGRDRDMVMRLQRGETIKDIGSAIGGGRGGGPLSEKTVFNRLTQLRELYGNEVVPFSIDRMKR